MYYVYVLKSLKDNGYYIGFTNNLEKRLNDHNCGKNYSTKLRRPWVLIHVEVVNERRDARMLEKFFKSGYGREMIKEIDDNLTS